MFTHLVRTSVALVLVSIAGCAEPVAYSRNASSLALVLPSDSALSARAIDVGSRVTSSAPPASDSLVAIADRSGVSTAFASQNELPPPLIRRSETQAQLTSSNPSSATVSAWTEFFGSTGEQILTIDLTRGSSPFLYQTRPYKHVQASPGWYTINDFLSVSLGERCGYGLAGNTEHRASTTDLTSSRSSATVSDYSYSSRQYQPECPPEREIEERWGSDEGGSPADNRIQSDEWYMCTFEVWYNQYGEEISRRFLGCRPM